jgi:hypothetical protein
VTLSSSQSGTTTGWSQSSAVGVVDLGAHCCCCCYCPFYTVLPLTVACFRVVRVVLFCEGPLESEGMIGSVRMESILATSRWLDGINELGLWLGFGQRSVGGRSTRWTSYDWFGWWWLVGWWCGSCVGRFHGLAPIPSPNPVGFVGWDSFNESFNLHMYTHLQPTSPSLFTFTVTAECADHTLYGYT